MVAGACNAAMPPSWFCQFGIASLAGWRREPKFRTWVRFPTPAPEIRKIHVDSAALAHQTSLDLRPESRGFAPILRPERQILEDTMFSNALATEHRFLRPTLVAIQNDGLEVGS